MSETLSQIIAKMGTPAKPTGSTPKVPKEPKVPKVVQKARQTAVKRSPNPFVQAVEQAFKPTTPTKPQEPNLGQIIKQFKDVASSGRKQRGETLMQEYIRNTQPVSGNMGFKAGSGKGATIEAEMAAYDRKTFGAETYGKRPKGVSTAEWSKRQSHKGKFKQLAGTRNEQVAELDREIEAYKLENMTPVQRLELARETSGGLPGFYDKERASALAASLMGSQDLKDKTDASLFIRAANQVMQPVSTAYTVAMKDPRSLAEMPVGLQVGLSAGDLGAQIVGGFLTGGGSTPATASTLARIGAVATRSLALDAPGYIQMIEDAGGVDKALVAYKDMIGKALDPNSKISASERVNGIALAGMIVLSGGGKIAGKGPHADPNITTRLIETEAVPGSASDLRGQVGGVGLDAEPALRSVGEYADEIAAAAEANRGRSREPETQREQRSPSSDEKQLDLSQEPAAKSRKGVQEPWQKTLEQLRRGNSRVAKPGTPRYYESQPDYDLSKLIRSGDRMAIIEASKRSMERGFRSPGEWENAIQREADALRETHRDAIVKALAEGKRVPPEVLADYPLLKPAGRVDAQPPLRPGVPEPDGGGVAPKGQGLKELVEGFDDEPPMPRKGSAVPPGPAQREPRPQPKPEPSPETAGVSFEGEVFHGTPTKGVRAETLDPKHGVEVRGATWFTDSEDVADQYSFEREYGEIVGDEPGTVVKTRIRLSNPMIVDFGGDVGDAVKLSKLVNQAKEAGHDGLIVKNVDDSVDSSGLVGTSYAVFDKSQIAPPPAPKPSPAPTPPSPKPTVPPETPAPVKAKAAKVKPDAPPVQEPVKARKGGGEKPPVVKPPKVNEPVKAGKGGEEPKNATGLARQFTDPERFARDLEETRAPAKSIQKLVDETQADWDNGGSTKADQALRRANDPEYEARLMQRDPEIANALRRGVWTIFAGQMFPTWSRERVTCKSFEIPDHWPKWRALDYGFVHPFAAGWATRNPQTGRIYVYRAVKKSELTDVAQARLIRDMTPQGELVTATYASPDMWARKTKKNVIFTAVDEYKSEGVILTQADNDRKRGVAKLHGLLEEMLDGYPGIQVFEEYFDVFKCMTTLVRDKDNPEDVEKVDGDDAYDMLRYLLTNYNLPAKKQKETPRHPWAGRGNL